MKISQILNENEIWPNAFFGVLEPIDVWKFGELEGTGAYVGGFGRGHSQLMQRKKIKTTLQPGDEIHYLHGGTFAVKVEEGGPDEYRAKEAFAITILEPSGAGPFEKNYGPSSHERQARKFHQLVQKQSLRPLDKNEAVKTRYPR